jgi:DNA-binding ferritin-like protein
MNSNQELLSFFFEMLNTIKLYHWNTKSFAEHKATDELHSNLSELIDEFVEVLLGKQVPLSSPPSTSSRIKFEKTTVNIYHFNEKEDFIKKLKSYNRILVGFNEHLGNSDTDLLNIRDELLGSINKTLYLFSLSC